MFLPATHPLPLERFSWNPKTRTLSAFESDLRSRPFDGNYHWLVRLYDDACDVGCVLRSHHTGREARYVLSSTEERDGDLLAWNFVPAPGQPELPRCLIIFND